MSFSYVTLTLRPLMPSLALRAVQNTLKSSALVLNAAPSVRAACAHIVMDVFVMPMRSSAGVNSLLTVPGGSLNAPVEVEIVVEA